MDDLTYSFNNLFRNLQDMTSLEGFLFFWIVGSLIAAIIAMYKHRSGLGFMLLSLLVSPLIGILGALLVMPNEASLARHRLAKENLKKS